MHTGDPCIWFGKPLKNCQDPELTAGGVEVVETEPGHSVARLLLEATAPWNSDPSTDDATKLELHWTLGGAAKLPGDDFCLMSAVDHAYNVLEVEGLTCDGAPYDLGTYSVRGRVCAGRTGCEKSTDVNGIRFLVSKAKLGCPIEPKKKCNGDQSASCADCLPGGVEVEGTGPGVGGEGGEGNPAPGGGAYLYYAAGGAGHEELPGSASWNATLGRHWSHSYAERIVEDPEESHVWLITLGDVPRVERPGPWERRLPDGVAVERVPDADVVGHGLDA